MRFRLAPLLLLLLPLLTACNGLFYFPDPVIRTTPSQVDVRWRAATVHSQDGTKLIIWHLLPEGAGNGGVVLQFHGNGQNMSTHFLQVAWLTKAGFDVVTFDYRGYGESEGTPSREGLFEDGKAVVEWIRRQPDLAKKDLFLFGQSLGGNIAIPVAATLPPYQVSGLAVESTFASYRDLAQEKLAGFWLSWPFQWPLSFLVSDELSAIDSMPFITEPFLVIHGTADPVVPYADGQRLFAACIAPDKEFWEVPKGGHLATMGDDDGPWRERFVEWLCGHMRTRKKRCEP
jgi:alpha-beta hydrolase superfamily lysophospholipase